MKKKLLVLFGGESSEHEVSCVSAANVCENADKNIFDIILMGITKDGKWWLYDGGTEHMRSHSWQEGTANLRPAVISPCKAHHGILVFDKPRSSFEVVHIDIVFPVLHGRNGEDGRMQGLLELSGIPYVGSDTFASAVGMDKEATKLLCRNAGVPVVPFIVAYEGEDEAALAEKSEREYGFPVFVKPANAGSSVGITKAHNEKELLSGIRLAFENDKKLLIEPAVEGREIEIAVYGNEALTASVCGEIIPHSDFYDYETKYINDSAECIAPAEVAPEVSDKMREAACRVYKALGCAGLSRVDFFLTDTGFMLNEINTLPGFTPISMYPKLMQCMGVSYGGLITGLAELAEKRHG